MKVFGIGLNKTGTKTLGRALEILGYTDHVSYSPDLVLDWSEGNLERIFECIDQNNNFEDLPWPLIYEKIYERIEDSKFILTTRSSAGKWIESYLKHAERQGPKEVRRLIYGQQMPHGFENQFISVYEKHNKAVVDFFSKHAPEKLKVVCFESGDGWQTLCDFLHKPIPQIDFPWLNKAPDSKS
jgi:hypothetical protein